MNIPMVSCFGCGKTMLSKQLVEQLPELVDTGIQGRCTHGLFSQNPGFKQGPLQTIQLCDVV